jgi:hypothetical protein
MDTYGTSFGPAAGPAVPVTGPTLPGAPAPFAQLAPQPAKGLVGCATSVFKKYKKFIIVVLLAFVGYFLYKKYGKKNPPAGPPQLVNPGQPQVQVPPPPAVDPNFTRLAPPTTA